MNELDRIRELTNLLNEYSIAYYTHDEPMVSDKEYDLLYDELRELEIKNNIVLENSPTQRIGGEILDKFEKVSHLSPLWSLDKSKTFDELREWDRRNRIELKRHSEITGETLPELDYILEYKFDGLTVNLTYEDGLFKRAATRGNGTIGEDITLQVKTVLNVPLSVDFKNLTEIQGEGMMPLSTLERYNETHEIKLKNARNAAAGALRNLDTNITRERGLRVFVYNVGYMEGMNFQTHMETLEFLRKANLPVYPYIKLYKDFEELLKEIELQGSKRSELDLLTDGMCIKINSIRLREILGYTNKFPRWAMAYKYEEEEVITELIDVVWNVGRTGKVTPSAILEPVEIAGATISRATLNNYDDILRKNVRLKGDVLLRRSNEVIPEILEGLETDRETFEIIKPHFCPFCHSELFQDGVHIFCPNSLTCKPQLVMRIVHFASRDAMNIEGLSEKTVELLMEHDLINHVSDLYKLKFEDLIDLPLFKEKKSNNLLNAINNSKKPELSAFIYAIGIKNIGIATSKSLSSYFKTWDRFKNTKKEELMTLPDIGEIVADSIIEFLNDGEIKEGLNELFKLGIEIKEMTEEEAKESIFSNKTVVITGSFNNMKRKEMEELIFKLGGKTTSSVSKNTDFVIYGDSPGSKLDKGRELGIRLIDEAEWEKIIEEV